jgi:flavin reductase (DIM6/NTAB) family NADH-FMN oxidoreductase RutF
MQPDQFRQIAGQWLTGVAVVTAMESPGQPCGMTMNAVTSLSLEPPQFLVCMDQRARTLAAIRNSGSFCINYLREDQREIAVAFARPGEDRFGAVTFQSGATGSPVIDGTIAYVECRLNAIHPGGDHWIVIGDAVGGAFQGGRPLAYFSGRYRRLADIA